MPRATIHRLIWGAMGACRSARPCQSGAVLTRSDTSEVSFIRAATGPNYTEDQGHFTIRESGVEVADVWSSKRLYTARQMPTTEAGIRTHGLSQFYVTLGSEGRDTGSVVVRMWDKPLVTLIWLGALVMMAGGALSLTDRRLRVGAPKPARRAAPMATAE